MRTGPDNASKLGGQRGIHKGAQPPCGGSRLHEACQRFWLARSVPAAWGEPARPGLPPEGETGKGAISANAAEGFRIETIQNALG